jgi:hypothetical protein
MRPIRTAAALAILLVVAIAGFAQASDGEPLILGQQNTAESTTTVTSTADPGIALNVIGDDRAINAHCMTTACASIITSASSGGYGLRAFGDHGVLAQATIIGVEASGRVGVEARGVGPNSIGLSARALEPNAAAIVATGRTSFSRSGIVTVPAGVSTVKVTLDTPGQGDLSPGALVLAMVQQKGAGVFVRAAAPHPVDASSFTIYLNKIAPVDVQVGWFIVN